MGPIEATARALSDILYNENLGGPVGQILVICGRNKKLVSKLQSIDWKVPVQVLVSDEPVILPFDSCDLFLIIHVGFIWIIPKFNHQLYPIQYNSHISCMHFLKFQVKGFVTKMEESMGACDCIITKVKFSLNYLYEFMVLTVEEQIYKLFYLFIGWTRYYCRSHDPWASYYSEWLYCWTGKLTCLLLVLFKP